MAENKKSFVLYSDLIHTVSKMPSDKAGELFKHILKYVNDENPTTNDLIVQLTFEPIKQQLKRDLIKFEQVKEKRSQAGKRSAEVRKAKQNSTNSTNLTSVKSVEQTLTNSTVSVNDNDNVNDINIVSKDTCVAKAPHIDFTNLLKLINLKTGRNFKVINKSVRAKYKARLKEGYTKDDISNAISNAVNTQYHKDNNYKHLTPEFFSRADKIDAHSNTTETKPTSLADAVNQMNKTNKRAI